LDGDFVTSSVHQVTVDSALKQHNKRLFALEAMPVSGRTGPWIYVGTPTQVSGQTDVYGTLISDLVAANPAPFNASPWVPFEGFWNNSLGSDAPVSFLLDASGFTVIRGGTSGGSGIVFFLPTGFRPFYQQELILPVGDAFSYATAIIGTDGSVTFENLV
jgi:hypothetical protein